MVELGLRGSTQNLCGASRTLYLHVSRAVSLILLPSPVPPLLPASGVLAARVLNPEVYGHEVSLPHSSSRLNFPPPSPLA